MSILETFYILFESDAEDVEKGAKKAEGAVDDLEEKIGKTDKSVEKLGSGFLQMTKGAVASIAAAVSAGAILTGIATQAQHIEMLKQTSERLNVNIGEWQAWSRAVKEFGGDAGALSDTIRNLNTNLADIAVLGTSGISPFLQKLGIRIRKTNGELKNSLELLPELAEAFENLSRQEVEGFGAKLGLDPGTILMLMQGRRAVEEQIMKQKELGVVTERQARIAASYNRQVRRTKDSVGLLVASIGEYALPVFEKFMKIVEKITAVTGKYGRVATATLIGISVVILAKTVPALKALTLNLLRIPVMAFIATASMVGLGSAIGIVAASIWAALAPLLLWVAIGTAVVLVAEDMLAFFNGAPSAIGAMVDAFKGAVPAIKQAFTEWGQYAVNVIQNVLEWFRKVANVLTLGGFDKAVEGINAAKNFIVTAQQTPLAAQSTAAITAGGMQTNRSVNIGELRIETQATDADGISRAVGQSLTDELNRTLNSYDDGIRG